MELFSLLAKLTADTSEFHSELEKAKSEANNLEIDDPKVGLDTTEFESNAASAESVGQGFGTSMEEVFKGIKTALTVTGIVGAIAGIVNGLKEAVNMTAQTADGIDKGSARLNISKRKYQEWDHALRQSGASINDLQKGVIQFNKYVSSFEPGAVVENAEEAAEGAGGEMAQAFARLKLNVKDANGQLKSTETLIEESLIALAGFKGSKEERGTLVNALFGRGATSLNALLDSGVTGVKELLGEADKLGLIMSDEEITSAVEYGDAVANLNEEIAAIKSAFVKDIIPVLKDGTKFLTDLLSKFNPRLRENSLTQTFEEIDKKTKESTAKLDETGNKAEAIIEKLAGMGDYWTLDEQGKVTWNMLADEFVEQYPQFSRYIDREKKKINENTDAIKANIREWVNRQKHQILDSAFAEKQEAVAKQHAKALEKEAEAVEKEIEADSKRKGAVKEFNDLLSEQIAEREKLAKEADQNLDTTTANYQRAEADKLRALLLSDEASYDEFMRNRAQAQLSLGGNIQAQSKFGEVGSEWQAATVEAENLKKEAENLTKEANEAQTKLEAKQVALEKVMFRTQNETTKTSDVVRTLTDDLNNVPTDVYTTFHQGFANENVLIPKAIGSRYIPYDMPVFAHKGEEIKTASQARRENKEQDVDIAAFENAMIRAVERGMSQAQVNAYVTDREVARGTNRYNGGEIDSGRFRP